MTEEIHNGEICSRICREDDFYDGKYPIFSDDGLFFEVFNVEPKGKIREIEKKRFDKKIMAIRTASDTGFSVLSDDCFLAYHFDTKPSDDVIDKMKKFANNERKKYKQFRKNYVERAINHLNNKELSEEERKHAKLFFAAQGICENGILKQTDEESNNSFWKLLESSIEKGQKNV